MSFADDVRSGIDGVLAPAWSERRGTVVPTTESITLKDGAVSVNATYLYADLANSSALGQLVEKAIAAKVVRAYLNAAVRILRHYGGEIRSFDGDRVMAIFIGGSKNTNAARAALALNWAVEKVLAERISLEWSELSDVWTIGHGVGVDTGEAMLVRGGVRDNNDLVSIGSAPNVAAKLSEIRSRPSIYITETVFSSVNERIRTSTDGQSSRWSLYGDIEISGVTHTVYSSTWWWSP